MSVRRFLILLFFTILRLFTISSWLSPFNIYLSIVILANGLSFTYHYLNYGGFSTSWKPYHRERWWKLWLRSMWATIGEKDVAVLTDNNFSDFVGRNQYVMLNFYEHRCEWCWKLAPEYAAAATMLKGKAVLAKIDSKETKLAMKFKVTGWPTLYLLIGGAHKVLYDSKNRTRDAIANWVNQIMNITVQNVTTNEEAERILSQAIKSVTVLGLLDTLEAVLRQETSPSSNGSIQDHLVGTPSSSFPC
ncbi:protein disulfide isomerase-like 1-3 [Hevea brasiliensis]|uniref:protein disulfide isomerase-like 1-3 n=1 Tax=Hevea brasiliensis TaxID=3981 RepID=UPI0025FB779D|nr:protein disulfide isomerase-like 1-3 [Hevea brasiliensis]